MASCLFTSKFAGLSKQRPSELKQTFSFLLADLSVQETHWPILKTFFVNDDIERYSQHHLALPFWMNFDFPPQWFHHTWKFNIELVRPWHLRNAWVAAIWQICLNLCTLILRNIFILVFFFSRWFAKTSPYSCCQASVATLIYVEGASFVRNLPQSEPFNQMTGSLFDSVSTQVATDDNAIFS